MGNISRIICSHPYTKHSSLCNSATQLQVNLHDYGFALLHLWSWQSALKPPLRQERRMIPWPDCWNKENRIYTHSDHSGDGIKRASKHAGVPKTLKLHVQEFCELSLNVSQQGSYKIGCSRNHNFMWTLSVVHVCSFPMCSIFLLNLFLDRAQATIVLFLCMELSQSALGLYSPLIELHSCVCKQHNEEFDDDEKARERERNWGSLKCQYSCDNLTT